MFYVGKGSGNRYKTIGGRSEKFKKILSTNDCKSRIIKYFSNEDDAFVYEAELIRYYNENFGSLINTTLGGDGARKYGEYSDWQKKQIVKSRNSPESVYKSEMFRNKISDIVKGENNPNFGHKWTEDMKQSLSKKQKESGRYNGCKNPNSRKIKCLETGEEFGCISDAMKKYGVKHGASFTVAIDNPNRTAAKLH